MEVSRREALGLAAAFAVMSNHLDAPAYAQAMANQPTGPAVDVATYWSKFYDHSVITKGAPKPLPADKRKTVYVHAPQNNSPLMFADNIDPKTLPPIKGDVRVQMAISQFRPGKGDISKDVSHLRIDAVQGFDYMNIVAPLSWAAIASVTPDKNTSKIPSLEQFGFNLKNDTSGENLKQVILPGGVGNLAFNVTRPSSDLFANIIKSTSSVVTSALSMMTLPAISLPAIKVFTELLGKWQSHATVVMNGNLTPVVATSEVGSDVRMPPAPIGLKSGYYVMLPEDHKPELAEQFDQLTIFNGYLIRKDAPQSQDLSERAETAVQGVSYATLQMKVEQNPAPAACAKSGAVA